MAVVLGLSSAVYAQVNITKKDKVDSTDEMFIDMAVTAAKKSVADGGAPNGAVIILNGAWRSTGIPTGDKTAEMVAFEKSRRNDLSNTVIYTVNEPTTATIDALSKAGVQAVYFVNSRSDVVAAGVYPASAYDDSKIESGVKVAPLIMLPYPDGQALIKK